MAAMGNSFIVLLIVIFASYIEGSRGLSVCNLSKDELMTCNPAVTKPNPADPSPECCQNLSKADLPCLCSYKDSLLLPSLGIDPDLALELPAKCNLNSPDKC